MYRKIFEQTGYNLLLLKDDKKWLLDVLMGHGLKDKEVREKVGKSVYVSSSSDEDQKTESQPIRKHSPSVHVAH